MNEKVRRPVAMGIRAIIRTKDDELIEIPGVCYLEPPFADESSLEDLKPKYRIDVPLPSALKILCRNSFELNKMIKVREEDVARVIVGAEFAGFFFDFEVESFGYTKFLDENQRVVVCLTFNVGEWEIVDVEATNDEN